MQLRMCTKCMEVKDFDFFSGNRKQCKKCRTDGTKKSNRSKIGVVNVIYCQQKSNSKNRGMNLPTYSKIELKDWLFSQELFHRLYDNWKRLDFQSEYRPSVDRKDDYISYTIDNIQLMTWGENNSKGHKDRAEGRNNKGSMSVKQYTRDGVLISEYFSMAEASRKTNISKSNISGCCSGKRKTAGGFLWAIYEIQIKD